MPEIKRRQRRLFMKKHLRIRRCLECGADMTQYVKNGLLKNNSLRCSEKCKAVWRIKYRRLWQQESKKRIARNTKKWRKKNIPRKRRKRVRKVVIQ